MRRALARWGRRPLGLEAAQKASVVHGGACLSEHYVDSQTPLLWRCARGHEWMARLNDIRNLGA
eukprot:1397119-Prorocentrum_lima.AAC.1